MTDSELFLRHNRQPTPTEKVAIETMISDDQACLETLQRNHDRYTIGLNDAKDAIKIHRDVLYIAKVRYKAAVQIHETLRQSITSLSAITASEMQPTETNGRELVAKQMHALDALLQAPYRATFQLEIEEKHARDAVRDALEATSIAKEELQSALGLEALGIKSLKQCTIHINTIIEELQEKQDRLRPIWRVPDEVWVIIFHNLINYDFNTRSKSAWKEAISNYGPWYQQIRLMAICYRWRNIIQTNPSLWQQLVVVLTSTGTGVPRPFNMALDLSKSSLKQITLTGDCERLTLPNCCEPLPLPFPDTQVIESLRCDATMFSRASLSRWMSNGPIAQEWYIADFSEQVWSIPLPIKHCAALRKMTTRNLIITFPAGATPLLQEYHVTLSEKGDFEVNAEINAEIHSALHHSLRRNGNTIQVLTLEGKFSGDVGLDISSQGALNNLRQVRTTFGILAGQLGQHYELSSLRKIIVISSRGDSIDEWDQFLVSRGCGTKIQEVSLPSMDLDDTLALIPFINSLVAVKVLELHGDSVEPFLQARIDVLSSQDDNTPTTTTLSCLSALEKLDIEAYSGPGEVVLEFVEGMNVERTRKATGVGVEPSQESDTPSDQHLLFKLNLINCPNISNEMRCRITAALRQR